MDMSGTDPKAHDSLFCSALDAERQSKGWLKVQSLDMEAQGVARRPDGKVVFIDGALPGEWVSARVHRKKNQWEQATLEMVHLASSQRVTPGCPHFGLHPGACGGCKMQHLDASSQVAIKQRVLEDNLWHLAKVRPQQVLRPIEGPTWGYRYRARLSVRHVRKKGTVLIGFHERKSRYVADMSSCKVLPRHISELLLPLRDLMVSLDARETCPQIEVAVGEEITALVLRHLEPLSAADQQRLSAFSDSYSWVQWWLQPKGPDTAHLLDSNDVRVLSYSLPEFGLRMPFRPTDFTQVNPQINGVLVSHALGLLGVQPNERVIDWFCGLGNFTLPLACKAASVLGIEGSLALVERATRNALINQTDRITGGRLALAPVKFVARNLFDMGAQQLIADGGADRWLIDPPREGAFALIKALCELRQQPDLGLLNGSPQWSCPKRIVYVSCNPATLARDAGLLVHRAGYRCSAAGVVNMFPHTAHVESLAVFDLDPAFLAEPQASPIEPSNAR